MYTNQHTVRLSFVCTEFSNLVKKTKTTKNLVFKLEKCTVIKMRNNIVVNLLLAFVFLLILLHQWIGWRAEGLVLKNESLQLEFVRNKCLKQMDVDARRRTAHPDTQCYKFYLGAKPFDLCIPPWTKYLTAEMGIKCGTNGFWIDDRRLCMQTLVPVADETVLKSCMRAVGFDEFMLFPIDDEDPPDQNYGHRLVFFSDSCVVDRRGKILKCALHQKGDVEKYVLYRLNSQMIPNPLYDANAGC